MFRRLVFGDGGVPPAPAVTSPLHPAIVAELRRIDLIGAGLGDRAIRYVATGADEGLPAAIERAMPAQYNGIPFHRDWQGRSDTVRATDLALVRGEIGAGGDVARLMRLRIAARLSTLSRPANTPIADAEALAALFIALRQGVDASKQNYTVPWETLIPLDGVRALVKACGGTVADLMGFVLGREDVGYFESKAWHGGAAFTALATTYPVAVAHALAGFEHKPRTRAMKLLEHQGLTALPELSALLAAMLTRPYARDDRELAVAALARLDAAVLAPLVERELAAKDIDVRLGVAQAAGRNGSPDLLPLLAARAAVEKAAKVKAALAAALERGAPAPAPADDDRDGYEAIDGSFVAIPPASPIVLGTLAPASDADRAAFDGCIARIAADRAARLAKAAPDDPERAFMQPPQAGHVEACFALMTRGEIPAPSDGPVVGGGYQFASQILWLEAGRDWYQAFLNRQAPIDGAALLLALGHGHVQSLIRDMGSMYRSTRAQVDYLLGGIRAGTFGLAELVEAEVAGRTGRFPLATGSHREQSAGHLRDLLIPPSWEPRDYESPLAALPAAAVWPWLAGQIEVFDEALGLRAAPQPLSRGYAMATLALLPAVPQRYLSALVEIAVTDKRALRRQAMALLRPAAGLADRVAALLDDARQPVRANAATWLADLRAGSAEGALRKRLRKEKSDAVRTAIVEALQRLGADLSDVIGPASLVAEAEKALAKGPPALPGWLAPVEALGLHFRDGTALPPAVLRHWLALAIRLKEPGATGQFGIYLDQLDPDDARRLSALILDAWIAHDTEGASAEQATAYASAVYRNDWRWVVGPQITELRDLLVAEIAADKRGELLHSGTETKGVLALACRADAAWAAARVRWFLKAHGRRAHQAMALLDALAGIGAPAALQVVIAASVRLKQKSTQAHAAAIAARYAEDRGWGVDELADRTVPAAGFDDDGVLELPCGEDARVYTARLDARLAIHLFNPDGKPVKALPAGDDEATRAARKALSAAKKELAQVVDLQRARLFEAMCVERSWPVADWRLAFHDHPLMRRLVERLVWQGLDAEGASMGLFRPTQEGDFTDADDAAVALDGFARVRLAHGALVGDDLGAAWTKHLADYEVAPFIAQFDAARAALTTEEAAGEAIADRTGWVAHSRVYRGVIEKRGYERVMGDGGGCTEYAKRFPSHGIVATIHHTGSNAEDENNLVALKELRFTRAGRGGGLKLGDVPPVMLAECRADYHALAAKGAFDAEWERVCPW